MKKKKRPRSSSQPRDNGKGVSKGGGKGGSFVVQRSSAPSMHTAVSTSGASSIRRVSIATSCSSTSHPFRLGQLSKIPVLQKTQQMTVNRSSQSPPAHDGARAQRSAYDRMQQTRSVSPIVRKRVQKTIGPNQTLAMSSGALQRHPSPTPTARNLSRGESVSPCNNSAPSTSALSAPPSPSQRQRNVHTPEPRRGQGTHEPTRSEGPTPTGSRTLSRWLSGPLSFRDVILNGSGQDSVEVKQSMVSSPASHATTYLERVAGGSLPSTPSRQAQNICHITSLSYSAAKSNTVPHSPNMYSSPHQQLPPRSPSHTPHPHELILYSSTESGGRTSSPSPPPIPHRKGSASFSKRTHEGEVRPNNTLISSARMQSLSLSPRGHHPPPLPQPQRDHRGSAPVEYAMSSSASSFGGVSPASPSLYHISFASSPSPAARSDSEPNLFVNTGIVNGSHMVLVPPHGYMMSPPLTSANVQSVSDAEQTLSPPKSDKQRADLAQRRMVGFRYCTDEVLPGLVHSYSTQPVMPNTAEEMNPQGVRRAAEEGDQPVSRRPPVTSDRPYMRSGLPPHTLKNGYGSTLQPTTIPPPPPPPPPFLMTSCAYPAEDIPIPVRILQDQLQVEVHSFSQSISFTPPQFSKFFLIIFFFLQYIHRPASSSSLSPHARKVVIKHNRRSCSASTLS